MTQQRAPFVIFNASAGAGKTYKLVKHYLKLCLLENSPSQFREILAITFTNKAANEMKDRIMNTLLHFTFYPQLGTFESLFYDLKQETGFEEKKLVFRSRNILKSILHSYSAFSVSTIDKFTNRLIRSFSNDLKINGNYEIELNSESILKEAIDRFLASIEPKKAVTKALIKFIENQLTEGKSPRIEGSLLKICQELLDEKAHYFLHQLRGSKATDILEIRDSIYVRIQDLGRQAVNIAEEVQSFLQINQLDENLFSYGDLPCYIQKVLNQRSLVLPSKRLLSQVDGRSEFYPNSKKSKAETIFSEVQDELRKRMSDFFQWIEDNFPYYHLAKLILRDIHALAVVSEIENKLEEIKQQTNRLPIAEFNKIISDYLENQPAAFLYEKIGVRYRHYFIDEFQDTSVLQWKNLIPLINNAISSGGNVLLVGDAKQAIYRWRGGDVNQILDLIGDSEASNKIDIAGAKKQLYERQNLTLEENYRSYQNIVDFNNQLFGLAGANLPAIRHQRLFAKAAQRTKRKQEGYVNLTLLNYNKDNPDIYIKQQCENCLQIIRNAIQKRGYQLKDIAILTRAKQEAVILFEFLIENDVDVVSEQSLMIDQSTEVKAIISFFRILVWPDDYKGRIDFLEYLWATAIEKYEDKHDFLKAFSKANYRDLELLLESVFPNFSFAKYTGQSLLNKTYLLLHELKINYMEDSYLLTLLDKIQEFDLKNERGEASFLRWWDDNGYEISVSLPEDLNALKMMTIHKAKGLEFPITILAFADWQAAKEQESTAWVSLNQNEFEGLAVAKVPLSSADLDFTYQNYQKTYRTNKENIYLDNLNLLYVALTRAEKELYILGSTGRKDDKERVTIYFENYFQNNTIKGRSFKLGKPVINSQLTKSGETPTQKSYENALWTENLTISVNSPQNWNKTEARFKGSMLHEIMAFIKIPEDKNKAIDLAIAKGIIELEEREEIENLIDSILHNSKLHRYYENKYDVLNERDILIPMAMKSRPDRIVFENGKAHVIDYKYSLEQNKHRKQVEAYMQSLVEMGYQQGDHVLVYLGEPVKVEKW